MLRDGRSGALAQAANNFIFAEPQQKAGPLFGYHPFEFSGSGLSERDDKWMGHSGIFAGGVPSSPFEFMRKTAGPHISLGKARG